MSMLATLRRVTPDELDRLLAEPKSIYAFLYGEQLPQQQGPRPGFLARLFGTRREDPRPPPVYDIPPPPPDSHLFELGKNWHCLHFLLAGDSWDGPLPAAFLLHGGTEIGDVDVGYGPARALTPEQVTEFSQYLAQLTRSDLEENCDPVKMEAAEIYCAVSSHDDLEWLWEYVTGLRPWLSAVSEADDALLIYLY